MGSPQHGRPPGSRTRASVFHAVPSYHPLTHGASCFLRSNAGTIALVLKPCGGRRMLLASAFAYERRRESAHGILRLDIISGVAEVFRLHQDAVHESGGPGEDSHDRCNHARIEWAGVVASTPGVTGREGDSRTGLGNLVHGWLSDRPAPECGGCRRLQSDRALLTLTNRQKRHSLVSAGSWHQRGGV